ncbi:retrovirus-related pol polyprotein from transposon TNT 1-94 [Tanacetum coccineum]|uniref:Retrovirus-related pol polyprotein from transposon TNT 1-94 n=1 Tax=Tanacetum coccineum TaxID=301880 RepID=A0ABQ5HJM4_9ASTR
MSNSNTNLQTQTSNALHNAIMEAGGKDRPPMLAPGNYVQWKSQIKRYIDTKPNNKLIHYCLQNPPYKFKWTEMIVLVTEDLETNLYWEFGKFTSRDDESLESYYLRFYKMMNELVRNQCDVTNHQVNVQFLLQLQPEWQRSQQAATRNKGKVIVNSPPPTYDHEPTMVAEDDEMLKEKEIDKLMALISLSFKKIYKPTNNNLRTSSNTSKANQDNTPRINRGTGYNNQRVVNVVGARENVGTQVVQQSGIQCYNCKEYRHVARECQKPKRTQEVTPDIADNSGPIFDAEPLQRVQNDDDNYNVFANDREHPKQPESVNDTYMEEQGDTIITIDSLDMSTNGETVDQDDDDLAKERDLLASLIEKLKCEIDDNKNHLKKFQAKLDRHHDVNYVSKVEIDCAKAKGDLMSYKMESQNFVKPDFLKKAQRANPRLYDIGCYNDNLALMLAPESDKTIRLAQESRSKLSDLIKPFDYKNLNNLYDLFVPQREKSPEQRYFSERSKMSHTPVKNENSKDSFNKHTTLLERRMDESIPWGSKILLQNVKSILKNTNVIALGMYKVYIMPNQTRTTQLPQDIRKTNKRMSFSTGVIPTTSVSRPHLKSNKLEDRVMHNNSLGKKKQVEDNCRNFKYSNNKTSITACNDSLNAKTSNVNFVCVTCGKCMLNDNHDMCVLHYINGVNTRTKLPIAVPISTKEPKRTVNQSVATPPKKTVASESTNQKPRSTTRKQYEHVRKTCKWWYSKITPPGYKWKPKTSTVNVKPDVSMPLGNKSRTTNILESITRRGSTLSNTPLSSNSFAARTVKFGNDQIALILGYGDMVQGNVTIKMVYYVEGLNHNLFSVGQFCDADLEVAFRKSTCYIRDLKGNDLLTGSRGTDLYSTTL